MMMKELSFTELDNLNATVVSESADESLNEYMSDFLMPRLSALSKRLSEAGTASEITLDMTITPGLNVHIAKDYDVYATFLADEDDEEKEVLRLAAYRHMADKKDDSLEETSWLIYDDIFWKDANRFLFAAGLFLSGVTIDAEALMGRANESDRAEGEALSEETGRMLPRINGLVDILSEGDLTEEIGVNGDADPYILMAGTDFSAMARYEATSSEDIYLLHLGAFIPFTKEELQTEASGSLDLLCRSFNNKYFSIRASIEETAPEGFAMDDVDGYIAIHTCVMEYGAYHEREFYERILGELSDATAEVPFPLFQ